MIWDRLDSTYIFHSFASLHINLGILNVDFKILVGKLSYPQGLSKLTALQPS